MAKIILEANESFEHFHSEDSTTTLLEGEANYSSGTINHPLEWNVPVLTRANQSHTITNTGDTECMFGCSH